MTTSVGTVAWWLAVGLAAVAGAVLPNDENAVMGRLSAGSQDESRRLRATPWWLPALVVALLVVGLGRSVLVGAAALAGGLAMSRSAVGAAGRRADSRGRSVYVGVLRDLAAELRGGAHPRVALAAATEGVLDTVAAAARSPTGDVSASLVAASCSPGGEVLADLAAAWTVADRTGAALAGPAAQLAVAARNHESVRRELDAALAGPRASALLLSALPLAGVALGSALGTDPSGFLLGTVPGHVVLLLGTSLAACGVAWTETILRQAVGP